MDRAHWINREEAILQRLSNEFGFPAPARERLELAATTEQTVEELIYIPGGLDENRLLAASCDLVKIVGIGSKRAGKVETLHREIPTKEGVARFSSRDLFDFQAGLPPNPGCGHWEATAKAERDGGTLPTTESLLYLFFRLYAEDKIKEALPFSGAQLSDKFTFGPDVVFDGSGIGWRCRNQSIKKTENEDHHTKEHDYSIVRWGAKHKSAIRLDFDFANYRVQSVGCFAWRFRPIRKKVAAKAA